MNYFLDSEFNEDGSTIDLISIAVVAEDQRELYAVSSEFDRARCGEWLQKNVFPHLPAPSTWKTRAQIREELLRFVGEDTNPRFWAYYASYDWVVLAQLFGRMIDLPKHFPKWVRDIKQLAEQVGYVGKLSEDVSQMGGEHDALCDARWTRDAHRFLRGKGTW